MPSLRILLVVLTLGVVAATSVWFLRDPISDAVRPKRFRFLLQQSERAMKSGDKLGAQRLAREAWQLQSNDLVLLTELMMHSRELKLGDLQQITTLVFHHPDAEVESQREILRWLLDRGDSATFSDFYQNMGSLRNQTPGVRLLHAEALAREGLLLEAVEEARMLADLPETAEDASLLLTSLLPRMEGNPLAWEQARQRIAAFLNGSNQDRAIKAWRNLRLLPPKYRDPGPEFGIQEWLGRQPEVTSEDRLLGRQIELSRLPDADREAAVARVLKEFGDDQSATKALSGWLLESGLPERLLEISEEAMRQDVALYNARLLALIDTGRLEDAEAWLQRPHPEMSAVLVNSLKAGLASRAGRRSDATRLWQLAVDQARSFEKFVDCVHILKVADQFHEVDVVNRALEVILKLPALELPPSQKLEFLEERLGDRPELLRRFWEDLLRFRPTDPLAGEHVAFFHLFLTDVTPAGSGSDQMAAIVKGYPKVLRFRTTQALWLMREGKDPEAAKLLKDAAVNWNEAAGWDRAVYTLALYRIGDVRSAQALESGLFLDRLSPLRRAALGRLSKLPGSSFVISTP